MEKNEKKIMRRTLIYLFEFFNKDNNLVFKELLEKNLTPSDDVIDVWFKENNIDENAYRTILDGKRASKKLLKNIDSPVFVELK